MNVSKKIPKKIGLILPYAVSIRDFVTSGAMHLLAQSPDISVTVYTLNPQLPEFDDLKRLNVKFAEFKAYDNNSIEAALKGIYLYAFADKFAYVEQLLKKRRLRRIVSNIAISIRKLVGVTLFLQLFERVMLCIYRYRRHERQLDDNFELVIGTRSLLNSIDYGLIAEARSCGVPLITLAGSWDNFTTKGFFPFKCERIAVWNLKMTQELTDIFSVDLATVDVVGYPRKAALNCLPKDLTAAEYLKTIGYSGYNRFVLYSASYSELTLSPEDKYPLEYEIIAKVCAQLESALPKDVCILIRLHPFSDLDGKAVFDNLKRSFVFIPGRRDKYVERVMGHDDEINLVCQLGLSNCVVSLASTITIDALSIGKHVVNTNFDPRPGIPLEYSITRFFEYNHFKDLADIVNIPIAYSVDQAVDFVLNQSSIPLSEIANMEAFVKWYVPENSEQYAENVYKVIGNVLNSK